MQIGQLFTCSNSIFNSIFRQCRPAFLVNSDLTLRAQLTEFHDHKLIRSKKGTDGMEYLLIPLENVTLLEFLEKYNSSS
jgi:origin recognition complex subunit 2